MSAQEIAMVSRHFRERIHTILTPDEQACYAAYEQRVLAESTASTPVQPTQAEQLVLNTIAADTQAAALQRQLLGLMGVVKLPQ